MRHIYGPIFTVDDLMSLSIYEISTSRIVYDSEYMLVKNNILKSIINITYAALLNEND